MKYFILFWTFLLLCFLLCRQFWMKFFVTNWTVMKEGSWLSQARRPYDESILEVLWVFWEILITIMRLQLSKQSQDLIFHQKVWQCSTFSWSWNSLTLGMTQWSWLSEESVLQLWGTRNYSNNFIDFTESCFLTWGKEFEFKSLLVDTLLSNII